MKKVISNGRDILDSVYTISNQTYVCSAQIKFNPSNCDNVCLQNSGVCSVILDRSCRCQSKLYSVSKISEFYFRF